MTTDVIKSIGTAGGRDYSTFQSWFDSISGRGSDLVSRNVREIGEAYNDSEFGASNATLIATGLTTDATRYALLRAATGQAWQDAVDARTNPLVYDQSKGVGFATGAPFFMLDLLGTDFFRIERIQWKSTAYYSGARIRLGFNSVIKDCIFDKGSFSTPSQVYMEAAQSQLYNCVVRGADFDGVAYVRFTGGGGGLGALVNCLVQSNSATGSYGVWARYGTIPFNNSAIFGFAVATSSAYSGGYSGDYNATDYSSLPGGGSHNLISQTASACFENAASDFRLKAGSPLIDAGNTDATNAPNDITGTARGVGTAGDIGPWEFIAASAVFLGQICL